MFFNWKFFFSWSGSLSASGVSCQSQMVERNGTMVKVQFLVSASKKFLILIKLEDHKYGLLTKREVKMAGYWPSSFFACLWTETKLRSI